MLLAQLDLRCHTHNIGRLLRRRLLDLHKGARGLRLARLLRKVKCHRRHLLLLQLRLLLVVQRLAHHVLLLDLLLLELLLKLKLSLGRLLPGRRLARNMQYLPVFHHNLIVLLMVESCVLHVLHLLVKLLLVLELVHLVDSAHVWLLLLLVQLVLLVQLLEVVLLRLLVADELRLLLDLVLRWLVLLQHDLLNVLGDVDVPEAEAGVRDDRTQPLLALGVLDQLVLLGLLVFVLYVHRAVLVAVVEALLLVGRQHLLQFQWALQVGAAGLGAGGSRVHTSGHGLMLQLERLKRVGLLYVRLASLLSQLLLLLLQQTLFLLDLLDLLLVLRRALKIQWRLRVQLLSRCPAHLVLIVLVLRLVVDHRHLGAEFLHLPVDFLYLLLQLSQLLVIRAFLKFLKLLLAERLLLLHLLDFLLECFLHVQAEALNDQLLLVDVLHVQEIV